MFLKFLEDECGADVIEYALLAGAIGLAAVAAWNVIPGKIAGAYSGWDSGVQNLSDCTPNPGGGGC